MLVVVRYLVIFFFFSSRRRHTRSKRDWSSDVCSSDLAPSRNLVACLREGAQRFGWQPRDPQPRARRAGPWLIGTGVAASTYPALQLPAAAIVKADQAGNYQVRIDAIDIGNGAWTALTQIAADALE